MKTKKLKYIVASLMFFLFCTNIVAQNNYSDGNNQYSKIGGIWYLIDSIGNPVFEVESTVITVKFINGVTTQQKNNIYSATNVYVLRENSLGFIDLEIQPTDDVVQVLQAYINSGLCQIAELNTFGQWHAIPNDPFFSNQWNLNQILAPDAWDIVKGNPSVVVAIIDAEVQYLHEDIYQNIWTNTGETPGNGNDDDNNGYTDDIVGWDCFDDDAIPLPPSQPLPPNFPQMFTTHGTRVAGIVGAKSDNGIGIAGIAGGFNNSGIKLMILRVGSFGGPTTSAVCEAIDYAVNNGADIIQMSLGLDPPTSCIDAALISAHNSNVFVVCASGNDGVPTVSYPASDQSVMAVGGTDINDDRASCSNHGPDLEISAPSNDIWSTSVDLDASHIYFDTYANASGCGTSFAAPQVSALAALMLSVNSCLYNDEIRTIIQNTADKVGPYTYINGRCDELGYGRINAYQAVLAAQNFVYPAQTCTTNSTWSTPVKAGDIIIEPGVELQITSTVSFSKNSKIIVKPNAKLIIDGGTLTSKCMWEGIEVWGDASQSQLPLSNSPQGYVEIKNKANIENAINAISLWEPGNYNSTGGIVRAYKATFKNNKRCAEFRSYQNYIPTGPYAGTPVGNESIFKNCDFITNRLLNDPSLKPDAFVYMAQVDGIKFNGCKFVNSTQGVYSANDRGIGIESVNAKYKVSSFCTGIVLPCPSGNLVKSEFEGLYYGIYARSWDPFYSVNIRDSEFNNNLRGIFLRGVDFAYVKNNIFDVGAVEMGWTPYGLYLFDCTGYSVENNDFGTTHGGMLGSTAWNSGTDANEIYGNTYTDLIYGAVASQINDGPTQFDGLQIRCNTFENIIQSSIAISTHAIANPQGFCTDETTTANNMFSNICTGNSRDIWGNAGTTPFVYNYHESTSYNTEPLCYNAATTTPHDCQFTSVFDPGIACAGFDPDCGYSCLQAMIDNYGDQAEELAAFIDGGNAQFLIDIINQGNPGQTRKAILKASPYVSDLVLIAAIYSSLPTGILLQLINANSPVSDDVMDALNNIFIPKGVRNQIDAKQTGTSAREVLEIEIASNLNRKELTASELIRRYIHDDVILDGIDRVIALLDQDEWLNKSRKLTSAYINKKDNIEAAQMADHLETLQDVALNNFSKLQRALIEFDQTTEGCFKMQTDSVLKLKVEEVASAQTKTQEVVNAQVLLEFVFEKEYPEIFEPIILSGNAKWSPPPSEEVEIDANTFGEENKEITDNSAKAYMSDAYPNPFSNSTVIEYYLPEESQNAEINVFDIISGSKLKSYELNQNGNSKIIIETSDLSPGLYIYELYVNGSPVSIKNFIIIK
ncbi:MAG: S8 family peptidase [Bacteroidota bacterium]